MTSLPLALLLVLIVGPALASDSRSGRACPQALAVYASSDRTVALEFKGTLELSFRLLVEGQPDAYDGFIYPGEDVLQADAVVLNNCPEGDVTGEELAACTVWQGPLDAIGPGGRSVSLGAAELPAVGRLHLLGLSDALVDYGVPLGHFENLLLAACQE